MTQWTDVAAAADLWEGAGIAVEPQGQDIVLFFVDGEVFATDNQCTHGLAGRPGACVGGPVTEPVKRWPVKVEGGRVWLDLG